MSSRKMCSDPVTENDDCIFQSHDEILCCCARKWSIREYYVVEFETQSRHF
jgi:hypothetical protein